MKGLLASVAVAIALAPAAATATASGTPSLTPRQAFTQIRACLVQRGAFVVHDSDSGGGFAYWGRNHSATGHWGSWSYATQQPSNRIVSILTANTRLNNQAVPRLRLLHALAALVAQPRTRPEGVLNRAPSMS